MNRLILTIAATGALICALPALGSTADTTNHALKDRRDINACMSRRMAADRMLSYNDASKVCKEQLALRKPTPSASGPQLAANNNPAH
jgi:hypothetical protein